MNPNQIRRYHVETPLYYDVAPNEMLVPYEVMEKEFLALAETEGIAHIEELNKLLDQAVHLKNFLKGKERISKVARLRRAALCRQCRVVRLQGFSRGGGSEAFAPNPYVTTSFHRPNRCGVEAVRQFALSE